MRPLPLALSIALVPALGLAQNLVVDTADLIAVDDMEIVTADGARLGEVENVLVDKDGMVAAYVLEVGGFLGLGEHDVAVSPERLSFQDGRFVTDLTKEQLEQLPEYED